MTALRRLRPGLRTRLAVAMVGVTILAVALATALSNRGLEPRLSEAARERLDRSAAQLATVAADLYRHHHGWKATDAASIRRVARLNGLELVIRHRPQPTRSRVDSVGAGEAPIVAGGRVVGALLVSPRNSHLLAPEDFGLKRSLDHLHLLAGVVSALAAFVLAVALAHTLTVPLRRVRAGAERIARGDLDARVRESGGGPEVEATAGALNRLAHTLAQEEALRKESVADLAHELRTPASGLLSRIEAAQDDVFPDRGRNLAAMHAEALRLTRLLEDLSALAAAQRPGLLLEKAPVDLASIAGEQVQSFAPAFAERQVVLHLDACQAWLLGDEERLRQVVANLLANALRYTETGGSVSVAVSGDARQATLRIEDSGIGIAAEDLPHIFKRFWRGEKSRSRATGGAGIGLAITEQLVAAHDGRIEVESRLGQGSAFTVVLPTRPGGPLPTAEEARWDRPRPTPGRSSYSLD